MTDVAAQTPAADSARSLRRARWIGFKTIIIREYGRIIRIWAQTIVPSAVTSALYFVIFGSLIGRRVGLMDGVPYMQYIAPGLIMMAVITNSYGNVVSSFFGAKFGKHVEEMLVAPLPNWIIILGYVGGGLARGFLVGGAVTLFLLAFVVPKFAAIYADLGRDQPLSSRLLMEFGSLLNEHGVLIASFAIAALAVGVHAVFNRSLRERLMRSIARLPGIGERMRIVQLTRLYRTAGMLLRGGIPAVQALGMVGELLPANLRGGLAGALREIREGKPLSASLESHALTTPVAVRMLRVGERTGDMGGMMERIAAFHDEEIAHWVDRSTRLFEPLLMVVIGLVIGVIVMALYMPIFELAGSLQ